MAKGKEAVLVLKGCDTCKTGKDNGMCREKKCIDVNSKLGKKIDSQVKADAMPQCVIKKKNGKWQKCSTAPILSRYVNSKKSK